MTDADLRQGPPAKAEFDALAVLSGGRLDALAALAEDLAEGGDADAGARAAAIEAELEALRREHRVRLAALGAKHVILRDGAVQGAAPRDLQIEALHGSDLFDADWYLGAHEDLRRAGQDPAEHHVRSGAFEMRDPGPGFSTLAYYLANPDVAAGGWPALVHWEMYGRAEGRRRTR